MAILSDNPSQTQNKFIPGTATPYTFDSCIKPNIPIISATSVVAMFSPFHLNKTQVPVSTPLAEELGAQF